MRGATALGAQAAARAAGRRALAAALLLAAGACAARAGEPLLGADKRVARHASRGGGGLAGSLLLAMRHTVGEVGGGAQSGGGLRLTPGFIPLSAQPGSVTAITALSKSTGTVDLAWTAPGGDGFQGAVPGGVYRLDYSTDPAHAFRPDRFQLELATSVAPGQASALTLTGLAPNTTYFTRVYLGDAGRVFAEDSTRSDESTLANAPVDPVIALVTDTQVLITWTLPAGGAAGFRSESSSTSFGGLLPGGVTLSSATVEPLVLSLTVEGLTPDTTYFFRVASLNWQGERNFTVLLATRTLPSGSPLAVRNLALLSDARSRTVQLSWTVPVFADPLGVLVLVSTSATPTAVSTGSAFTPGQVLSDGAVVKSTALASGFLNAGLALDTTFFFHLFSNNKVLAYSVSASTAVFLDLPPLAPAGLASSMSADRSRFTLGWSGVSSSDDGTPFGSTASPAAYELSGFEVFRATSVLAPNWVRVATLAATAAAYEALVPDPDGTFLFKVESVDAFGARDVSMAVDTDHNLYVFAPDMITRLKVPAAVARELRAANNPTGQDLVLRAVDEAVGPGERVFRSTRFDVRRSPGMQAVDRFGFSAPQASVALRYETAGGAVVPTGPAAAGLSAGPRAAAAGPENVAVADAAQRLGLYWHDGSKYVKVFGRVDTGAQTVSLETSRTGSYQVRSLARASAFSFDLSQITNKAITPNGDGLNDTTVFRFENPRDSAISGKVYDIRGAFVSDMTPGPDPNTLQWDARANGGPVAGGVYVYQIRAEDKVFNGTLVVIR